jgi:hypothetical protein
LAGKFAGGCLAPAGGPANNRRQQLKRRQDDSSIRNCRVEPDVHRLRGDLLDATGDRAAAQQSYRLALTVAARQSAKTSEIRAATSLARLWLLQGKRDEARDLLAPIYNWFTEGFDTPVLREARAMLEQIAN